MSSSVKRLMGYSLPSNSLIAARAFFAVVLSDAVPTLPDTVDNVLFVEDKLLVRVLIFPSNSLIALNAFWAVVFNVAVPSRDEIAVTVDDNVVNSADNAETSLPFAIVTMLGILVTDSIEIPFRLTL